MHLLLNCKKGRYTNMKLYRYELYCEGEPQNVGMLVGIQDLGLSRENSDYLYSLFDYDLKVPSTPKMRNSVSFFTVSGHNNFAEKIKEVIAAYEDSLFDIMQITLDFPDTYIREIIYEDKDQVCLPKPLYNNKLKSLSTIKPIVI